MKFQEQCVELTQSQHFVKKYGQVLQVTTGDIKI